MLKECLVVLMILVFLGAAQIYITIAKHEDWGWVGLALLVATLLAAFARDSKNDR